MHKDSILIVDDEPDIVTTWRMRLENMGFIVHTAVDGQEGLEKMISVRPDIVLLDVVMPKLDGIELCRILKNDTITSQIPIIMLTAKGELRDKILGIETGADEYITKDAEPEEIEARIRMVLRRYKANIDANPLTRLPGNNLIDSRVATQIASGELFCAGYADLDNFKAFNDVYGFKKGDEVIKCAGVALVHAVQECGGKNGFVGHIGGDDFVFISDQDHGEDVCRAAIKRLDEEFPLFYNEQDQESGYITTRNRQGKPQRFPLLSVSIALVSNEKRALAGLGEIAQIASEVKKYLKTLEGSNFKLDLRED